MKALQSVETIKNLMKDKKGAEIKFAVRKGKKRKNVQSGIISNIYPSIFTVLSNGTVHSFSYIDVLTKTVEVAFVSKGA